MSFPINLIGNLVAIKVEDESSEYVRLPDWARSLSGTVLGCGPKVQELRGTERVSFGAAVGMDAVLNGQNIRIMREPEIDFVYE